MCKISAGGFDDRVCGVSDRACYSLIEKNYDVTECYCLDECETFSYESFWKKKAKK